MNPLWSGWVTISTQKPFDLEKTNKALHWL